MKDVVLCFLRLVGSSSICFYICRNACLFASTSSGGIVRASKASLIIKDMSQPVTLYAQSLSFTKSFHPCGFKLNNGICFALTVLFDSLEFPALTNAPFSTISSDFASIADTSCSISSLLMESRPLSRRER